MIYIVSGFIRSGTSMMMRMLEAGGLPVAVNERVRPRDANNPHGYYETFAFLELDPIGLANMDAIEGMAVKVLANALDRWPEDRQAKVIFMDRSMAERVRSMETFFRTYPGYTGPTPPLPPTSGPILVGGYPAQQRKRIAAMPQLDVLTVQYAEAKTSPTVAAVRVRDHLGVNLDTKVMASIYTDNLYRNRAWSRNVEPVP